MSELQRLWARSKVGLPNDTLIEAEEEPENDAVAELPEHPDDDSSSASSVSSTGTIIPSPNQNLFARPHGYVQSGPRYSSFVADVQQALHGGELLSRFHGLPTLSASFIYTPRRTHPSHTMHISHRQWIKDRCS